MSTRSLCPRRWLPFLLLSVAWAYPADVSAQEGLRVYGAVGPSPAIEEAAMVFATRNDVKVTVASGPRHIWRDKAVVDADLMFSAADFMMSDYARSMDLKIDEASVTPLYLRPSAILVRPGNPKAIGDFPDLVRPGMNVMVVNAAGHTGLWEDMAGKLEDIRTIRALRKNIVIFAADSDEAMKMWKMRDDIDAWITWNTWQMPLRGRAHVVVPSRTYRVLRQCSVALTARGQNKPEARKFIEFLASKEAGEIFSTWGWVAPQSESSPVTLDTDIAFVCPIQEDKWDEESGVGVGLAGLKRVVEEYKAIGIKVEELHVSAVVHGAAAYWLLKDDPYREARGGAEGGNPNSAIIRELIENGVSVEMCGLTMKERGWTKKDLLPDVKVVPAFYPRVIDLELQGYGLISSVR
ncbi:MAG: substrate-binding domain-containing protein [Phycisphaerales bacterium]|nr:MAG: substrate-binding domain-containing protein [Phycisphaerales bacterium]